MVKKALRWLITFLWVEPYTITVTLDIALDADFEDIGQKLDMNIVVVFQSPRIHFFGCAFW